MQTVLCCTNYGFVLKMKKIAMAYIILLGLLGGCQKAEIITLIMCQSFHCSIHMVIQSERDVCLEM